MATSNVDLITNSNTCEEDCANNLQIEKQELVIAELCAKAISLEIRDCIPMYGPSKRSNQIKTALNTCLKETLVETLTFLGCPGQEKYVKPSCVHNRLCRIQNLLPDTCQICQKEFCIKIEDTPCLACRKCGQEVHKSCFLNLLQITEETTININPFNLPGIHYLCRPCEEIVIPAEGLCSKKTHSGVQEPKIVIVNHPVDGNIRSQQTDQHTHDIIDDLFELQVDKQKMQEEDNKCSRLILAEKEEEKN